MSKLANLPGGKMYKLHGIEIEFKSVVVDRDAAKLLDGESTSSEDQLDTIRKLITKMVKEAVPESTESELKDCMRLNTLVPLMDIFYDINGMKDNKSMSNLEKIKSAAAARGKRV